MLRLPCLLLLGACLLVSPIPLPAAPALAPTPPAETPATLMQVRNGSPFIMSAAVKKLAAEPKTTTTGPVLRIRNGSPFILSIFVKGVRAGWIKPYRTELFLGLRQGYHSVYALSEYGSAAWGPRSVRVPGTLNVNLEGKAAENAAIAMASRVFNTNKATLLACDKLAERRGEDLSEVRLEFDVRVSETGESKADLRAEGVGPKLLSCYRTMVGQWKFPVTGAAYELSFSHAR